MTDAPRPRPRPVAARAPEPAPAPVERPRPAPTTDVPVVESPAITEPEPTTEPEPDTEPEPTTEPEPEPTTGPEAAEPPAVVRPTRASRRAAEGQRGAPSRVPARIGRSLAALCVVAGVAGFAVVRAQDGSPARHTAGGQSSATSSQSTDPDARIDDPDLATSFVAAASTGVVTVTESDYRRLDDNLSAGLAVTTGTFRTRFRSALTGSSAAARVANHSTTSVAILQSGIGTISASGTQAKVLIFARVTQTGDDVAAGDADVLTTLCVTVVRDGNSYLISNLVQGANAGLPPGTAGLQAAAEAARQEIIDTLSYSRSTFAADLARAKAGAAGAALSAITSGASALRSRLTAGKYDLAGAVTAVAVQSVSPQAVTMLVAATGTRTNDDGSSGTDTDAHYVVTVQRAGGRWYVSSISAVT